MPSLMMPSIVEAMAKRAASDTSTTLDMSTKAPSILAMNGAVVGVASVVLLARVYVRLVMLKTLGWDDVFMVLAMLCSAAVLTCFIGETYHGLGMHTASISAAQMVKYSHWNFFHSVIVTVGILLVKISIAFFLLRLVTKKGYKWFLIGMLIFLTAMVFVSSGTIIFSCIPVNASWDRSIKDAKCYSLATFTAIGLFNSCVNIITDVIFATLPAVLVWNLQVNLRTRISLIAILSLGYFACGAAIIKTYLQSNLFSNTDATRYAAYEVWNNVELNVGIIAACLPSLRPLFSVILDTAKGITSNSRSNTGGQSRYHQYYKHDDSRSGLKMGSMAPRSQVNAVGENEEGERDGRGYNVQVSGGKRLSTGTKGQMRSHSQAASSTDGDLKEEGDRGDRDSDELFIMREGMGIMKSVDVTIVR